VYEIIFVYASFAVLQLKALLENFVVGIERFCVH